VSKGEHRFSQLLGSKSRVASLNTITVPNLELCDEDLLAKLMHEVASLTIFNVRFYCWCDSTVALSWIRDEPSRLNVFLANRIAPIQELTSSMVWNYVPTASELREIAIWKDEPSEKDFPSASFT